MESEIKSPSRNLLKYVFEETPDGSTIFEWLVTKHYNITSFAEGDSHRTAFNEGRRAVIQDLINEMLKEVTEEEEVKEFTNE